MKRSLQSLLFAFLLVALASGCKTTRTVYKAPIKEEGPEYLVAKMSDNEFRFKALTIKYSASFTQEKKTTDFSGQLRMIKDSTIWISISPALGIEAIRLLITPDSVKYVNRLDKVYFLGDYAILHRFLDASIDFDILQALIIGNDFQFYEDASFRASIDNLEYKLSTTGRRKVAKEAGATGDNPLILVQNIWLNPENFKITRADLKEYLKDNKKLLAAYSDFQTVDDGGLLPGKLLFSIISSGQIDLAISFNRVSMERDVTFPFNIPEKYDQIR